VHVVSEPVLTVALIEVLVGILLLVLAADEFVEGSANLASAAQVSPVLVGAVIVGFGTSAPELLISVIAAVNGDTQAEDVNGEQVTDRLAARDCDPAARELRVGAGTRKFAADRGGLEARDVLEQPVLLDERQQQGDVLRVDGTDVRVHGPAGSFRCQAVRSSIATSP
jgi:hypothetical protein